MSRVKCFNCKKDVTGDLPDGFLFRATAECPECTEMRPDFDSVQEKCDRELDDLEARTARKVSELQSFNLSILSQVLRMFDKGLARWEEAETSLSAHEWLGLDEHEYELYVHLQFPKKTPLYKKALEEIRDVLSGKLTVQRDHTVVIAEIVEKVLKED